MKKVRVLYRSGRFLVPATILLNENGVAEVFLDLRVLESYKTKGSLSPREVSSVVPRHAKLIFSEGRCRFSVRKSRRKIEVLDKNEGRLLKYMGINPSEAIKGGDGFYCEIYVIKIRSGVSDYTLIANRRSTAVLENYLDKYCKRESDS
ncbi:MAG: hypothetical protein QXT76_01275 [Sulfolobales archaeon]